MGRGGSSSSDKEDGDAKCRAAIRSASAVDYVASAANGSGIAEGKKPSMDCGRNSVSNVQTGDQKPESAGLKLYQIKARKLLDDMLEKCLVIAKDTFSVSDDEELSVDTGVRLFRKAPPGIIFDSGDAYIGPTKRPQIIPVEEINEKSKKFRKQIRHCTVDGAEIMASAGNAAKQSIAGYEAKVAAAKAATELEEERVVRGEKWLPSVAREMQIYLGKQMRPAWQR